MLYSAREVLEYVREEDVKFIRLSFCDVWGRQKNVSIMPSELERAFDTGIAFDASAVRGFTDVAHSDLFLRPDPSTLQNYPWRPTHGRVVRMFCDITTPDGQPYPHDSRRILREAVREAAREGVAVFMGAEYEFYLFRADEQGNPTRVPHDTAGYMDIAPDDKGENVRREICLTLEEMGIYPESSHHEEGPGQHEIAFRYTDIKTAADQAATFTAVVKAIAARNGLAADFSPKPLENEPGNGLHINLSVQDGAGRDLLPPFMAGILARIGDMSAVLNPTQASYVRLGEKKAPRYISWSPENRSALVRIPAAQGQYRRIELRSPDPTLNPYLAAALLLYAGLEGIRGGWAPPPPVNVNLYTAGEETLSRLVRLPQTLEEAGQAARESAFVRRYLPEEMIRTLTGSR